MLTFAPARSLGSPFASPSASSQESRILASTDFATAVASFADVTGALPMRTLPLPGKADFTSLNLMPIELVGCSPLAVPTISCFAFGSQPRTVTSFTCWTPVTRARNDCRDLPSSRSTGVCSPPTGRKCTFSPSA